MTLFHRIAIALSLTVLVGCSDSTPEDVLIVLTSPDNPPFEFKDTAKGGDQVIGFDMDVAHMVAQRLKKRIKVVEADFGSIIPSLQANRADLAIATLVATDERRKSVDFSDPYITYKFAVVVKEDSTVTTHNDLKNKRIGAQLGSSHEVLLMDLAQKLPGISLTSLVKVGELIQELKNNRLDAVMLESTTAKSIVHANKGLKAVVFDELQGESPVIAFPKDSPLIHAVNGAINALKAEGKIDEAAKKWLTQ